MIQNREKKREMLDRIITRKKEEVRQEKSILPLERLKELSASRQEMPLDFAGAIRGNRISLIAEVKKASPSRGILCLDFHPVELAVTYAREGAAAVSVLTDKENFGGNIEYLPEIKRAIDIPLLRKDFILDTYQVYESHAYNADALLLIAAILEQEHLQDLLALSHSLGLQCLVEVHNEVDVEKALRSGAEMIGVNNRDLKDFTIDINTTVKLRPLIPKEKIVVSESGIRNREDVVKLQKSSINAILVGETLVTSSNIPGKIRELLS